MEIGSINKGINDLSRYGWKIEEISRAFKISKAEVEHALKLNSTSSNNKEESIIYHTINYTLDELINMVKSPPYEYVNFYNDKPIHQITEILLLPGEKFRKYPDNEKIEVSNFGRIKIDNKIIKQHEDHKEGPDYLYIKGNVLDEEIFVYRYVAKTWCLRPKNSKGWHVHHISNNGYDNRPDNLIWIDSSSHGLIKNSSMIKKI